MFRTLVFSTYYCQIKMQKWLWADTPEKVWLVVKHQKNSHLYLVCFTLMLHLWNHLDSELFKPGCRRPTGNCEFVNGHLGKKQFPRFTCVFSLITRKLTKTNEIVNNTSAQQHFHFLRKMATSGQHSCEQSPFFFFFTPHTGRSTDERPRLEISEGVH